MKDSSTTSIERRNLILGAGALLGTAAVGPVFASGGSHNHGGGDNALLNSALDCMKTSQQCFAHCLTEFKQGKTDMADCAQAVHESAIICEALWGMTSVGSKHLKKVAAACLDVCKTCEKECDKFAKKHAVCKDCRDSCTDLIKQIKKAI